MSDNIVRQAAEIHSAVKKAIEDASPDHHNNNIVENESSVLNYNNFDSNEVVHVLVQYKYKSFDYYSFITCRWQIYGRKYVIYTLVELLLLH